jgi:RimJ/RimL family protein N-acetyltransferase
VEPPKNSPTVLLNATPDLVTSRFARLAAPSRSPPAAYSNRERLYTCSRRGCVRLGSSIERRKRIYAEELETINGESVTLRLPREEDVEKVYEWDRDPELAAWNGRPPIKISLSAARRDYLARWEDPSVKTFIIEAEDEAIGLATLYDFRHEGCEVGIKIGPKDLRGRGYASEAVDLLVSYCFETLNLKVVRGSTLSHNTRMQRVFEKRGFREIGDGSIISRFDNKRYTELFYECRRDD